MRKLIEFFRDELVGKILRYVLIALLGVGIFLLIYLLNEKTLVTASNACLAPASVLLVLGFFSLMTHLGNMDFVSYGMISAFGSLKKNYEKPYEDLIDYKTQKKQQRQYEGPVYLPYFIFGLIFLVASIILLVISHR